MATTTYGSLRYPLSTASPNVNQDIQNLASDIDQKVRVLVANPTARNALSAKYDGMHVYEQSTQRTFRWNATGTRWDYVSGPWYTWSPTLTTTGGAAVTATTITARGSYVIQEGRCRFNLGMLFQGAINGQSGQLIIQMPSGVLARTAGPEQWTGQTLLYTPISAVRWAGVASPVASAATLTLIFPFSQSNPSMGAFTNATSVGATGTGTPLVAGSYPLADGSVLNAWGEYELQSWPAL